MKDIQENSRVLDIPKTLKSRLVWYWQGLGRAGQPAETGERTRKLVREFTHAAKSKADPEHSKQKQEYRAWGQSEAEKEDD
jgi:hypothetical protein